MATYFISEQYVKDNSPITNNIDPKLIYPHVDGAEKLWIRNVLGSEFYTYLKAAFDAETLNSDEIELVQNWIKPAELWRAIAMAIPWMQWSVRNKGLQTQNSDYSASAGTSETKYMINEADNRAQFYEDQLKRYLCKNENLFPQFINQTDALDQPDQSSAWDSGLLFY
jgi:hypothetical protein